MSCGGSVVGDWGDGRGVPLGGKVVRGDVSERWAPTGYLLACSFDTLSWLQAVTIYSYHKAVFCLPKRAKNQAQIVWSNKITLPLFHLNRLAECLLCLALDTCRLWLLGRAWSLSNNCRLDRDCKLSASIHTETTRWPVPPTELYFGFISPLSGLPCSPAIRAVIRNPDLFSRPIWALQTDAPSFSGI